MLGFLTQEQINKVWTSSKSSCSFFALSSPFFSSIKTGMHLWSHSTNYADIFVTLRYLVIPNFLTPEDTDALLTRSKQLLDEFDVESHPLVCSPHFRLLLSADLVCIAFCRQSSLLVTIIMSVTITF